MFENTAIKITTSKFASTSASLLPGSLILISGVVVWRLWYKQGQLQTKTSELSDELKYLKKQMAEIKATSKADSESVAPLSSSLKKMARFNPWSTAKSNS
ncbi:MAG: hypothetical protein KZQ83_02920 [gamma proteobacterium symbiont of Taylorina sp.]|nr:hypothetical protein [gamma proteobacterium symbiont of Taylorina sp.]